MIKTRKNFFRRVVTHIIGLSMCSVSLGYAVVPQMAPAAEDAYLKALEAEAKSSAKVTKSKSQPTAKQANPSSNSNSSTTAKGVNTEFQTQFEQILENERPATYRFYTKLPDGDKSSVVQIYKQSNKISTASKKVFDLYFNHMKK